MTTSVRRSFLFNGGLFALFLLVGLYFPTSSDEGISVSLYLAAPLVSAFLLTMLGLRVGFDEQIIVWFSAPIVLWLIFCTLLSSNVYKLALMPLALFCLLAFLFSLRVSNLRCRNITYLLALVSIANVCIGISMLTFETAAEFMIAHYNNFRDDLLPAMIAAYKPTLTFATHSVAGMFIYLFFWLNFRTYQKTGKRLHLALALLHVAMCIALMSRTSLAFAVVAIAELAWNFPWISALSAVATYLLTPTSLKETIRDAFLVFWFAEGNGFHSRYAITGNLANVISYIYNHPFLPIGATYSLNFFNSEGAQSDSGLVGYFLRGSIVLVVLVYGGLFLFLRRNLSDKSDCYRLFFVIIAGELGFTMLTYARSFLLFPAFMIYVNSLPTSSAQVSRVQSRPQACPS